MKTRSIFLLLILAIMLPGKANAQFGVLRRAINKQIDHKVDSTLDKNAQDKAKENEKANQQAASQDKGGTKETGRGLFGGKIDIKYNDEYKFTGRLYSQVEWYDGKDVRKSDFYTYFSQSSPSAGMDMIPVDQKEGDKAVPTSFLFDGENRCFMMLLTNSDSKTGIISAMPSDSAIAEAAKNQKKEQPVITKTGNSRTIAGYKCDEYKVVDPEKGGYSNVWMTKEVKIKADKKYWGKSGVPTYYGYADFEGAVMLATESFDKKDKPVMKMETKEINDNFSHSMSTVGYTFMKMNFSQAGTKK